MFLLQFVKTWNISPTECVFLVKVIVKTGHLAINQLDDVITDVKITGWANFARVSFQFLFFLRSGVCTEKLLRLRSLWKKIVSIVSGFFSSFLFVVIILMIQEHGQFISQKLWKKDAGYCFFILKGPLNKSTETACQNVCTTIINWLPTVKRLIGNISICKKIARLRCLSVHKMSISSLYHIFAILSQLW